MALRTAAVTALAAGLLLAACDGGDGPSDGADAFEAAADLTVTSPELSDGGTVPVAFTCEGESRPPPLRWQGVPPEADSLAIVVDDPDAPGGTYTHWVVWGLEASARGVDPPLPPGAVEGANDAGGTGYTGPCPPPGDDAHRYRFTVLALSAPLDVAAGASPAEARAALADVLLAAGRIEATYER